MGSPLTILVIIANWTCYISASQSSCIIRVHTQSLHLLTLYMTRICTPIIILYLTSCSSFAYCKLHFLIVTQWGNKRISRNWATCLLERKLSGHVCVLFMSHIKHQVWWTKLHPQLFLNVLRWIWGLASKGVSLHANNVPKCLRTSFRSTIYLKKNLCLSTKFPFLVSMLNRSTMSQFS